MTPFPVDAPRQTPGGNSPRLEYKINIFNGGPITVWSDLSPRNNCLYTDGLKYAVSIDDGGTADRKYHYHPQRDPDE